MLKTAQIVDVDQALDAARFSGLPLIVMVCTVIVLVLDGFDIQIIGFVAPLLVQEFEIERSALSPVLAASLVGMAIGGFAIGPLGDRYGRRPAMLGSTALFGISTALGATSDQLTTLAFWRLLTGIGLGGALPNAASLMAEFAPCRWRNQAIAAAIVGVPLGGMLGAALAAELLGNFGWRTLFVLGGLLPLAAAAAMFFVLPESPRFLAARSHRSAELAALLNRTAGERKYRGDEQFVVAQLAPRSGSQMRMLFSADLIRDTLAIWLVFASSTFAVYSFFSWSPVVLTTLGLDLASGVRGSFYFNLAGIIGALANSWVIARYGSRRSLAAMSALAAFALLFLARLTSGETSAHADDQRFVTTLMLGIAVAGLGVTAVQVGMYAVAAHAYPTLCRASGVGWAVAVGRIGGILSAFAGGMLLAQGNATQFFAGVSVALAIALLAVLAIRRHIPRQQ